MKLPRLFFEVEEGYRLPWWAGIVNYRIECRAWRCSPLVLNLALRFGWLFYFWLKRPLRLFDSAYQVEYWRWRAIDAERSARDAKDLRRQIHALQDEVAEWHAHGGAGALNDCMCGSCMSHRARRRDEG